VNRDIPKRWIRYFRVADNLVNKCKEDNLDGIFIAAADWPGASWRMIWPEKTRR
jgi:hypothetical protein